jgi:copper chaperone CopZ
MSENTSQGSILFTSLDIGIEGMTCDHCVRRVEKAIKGVPGVTGLSVNRQTAKATVTFDPGKTGLPAIHAAVVKSGYRPVS